MYYKNSSERLVIVHVQYAYKLACNFLLRMHKAKILL